MLFIIGAGTWLRNCGIEFWVTVDQWVYFQVGSKIGREKPRRSLSWQLAGKSKILLLVFILQEVPTFLPICIFLPLSSPALTFEVPALGFRIHCQQLIDEITAEEGGVFLTS